MAGILQLAAYAAVAFVVDWRIALLGGMAGLFFALAMNTLVHISKQAGYRREDRVSNLTIDMVDMLNNIKALKSMDLYGPLVQGLSGLFEAYQAQSDYHSSCKPRCHAAKKPSKPRASNDESQRQARSFKTR